jgi:hypothetical protein
MTSRSSMCSRESDTSAGSIRRYEIDDRFTIPSPPGAPAVVDVWCPIIPDTPFQRVVRIAVQPPGPWTMGHDTGHGNRVLRLGWIPVDASCACESGTPDLFGRLEAESRRLVGRAGPVAVAASAGRPPPVLRRALRRSRRAAVGHGPAPDRRRRDGRVARPRCAAPEGVVNSRAGTSRYRRLTWSAGVATISETASKAKSKQPGFQASTPLGTLRLVDVWARPALPSSRSTAGVTTAPERA